MATIVIREYNPTTGRLIGNVSFLNFGNVNVGEVSPVRVIDMSVPDVSYISNVRLVVSSADLIPVNNNPQDIAADGSAGNGNFGVETSSSFLSRNTLSRFFAGVGQEVTVGTRGDNVTNFVYLNVRMDSSSVGSGKVVYKWHLDIS